MRPSTITDITGVLHEIVHRDDAGTLHRYRETIGLSFGVDYVPYDAGVRVWCADAAGQRRHENLSYAEIAGMAGNQHILRSAITKLIERTWSAFWVE